MEGTPKSGYLTVAVTVADPEFSITGHQPGADTGFPIEGDANP